MLKKKMFDGYCIVDTHFDEYYAYEEQDLQKLCETLNKLNDDNKQLKHDATVLIHSNQDYRRENEQLKSENEQLREHFIYLIATALEDKECRKIYAKGLLEIFDDCANLDEAKIKIREYLE